MKAKLRFPTTPFHWAIATRLCIAGYLILLCLVGTQARATTVAYWQFEPGNPGADSSGNGNVLTINGATTVADVPSGMSSTGSLFFNGTNSSAVTASAMNLSTYKGLTIEFFMKTNNQSALSIIYELSTSGTANSGAFYMSFNEPAGWVRVLQGNAPYAYRAVPYAADSSWHHYAETIDNSGSNAVINIYIDGILQTNAQVVATAKTFRNDKFYLGARSSSTLRFSGKLDEFRISNRVLPPSGFLIAPPLVNASIVVTQPPTNTAVLQNRSVSFALAATLQNGDPALLEYQWYTNGVIVPNATTTNLVLPRAYTEYNNMNVSAVVSTPSVSGVTPVTNTITLTVQPDIVPPVAVVAIAQVANQVSVLFNELLNANSATNPASYSLDGGVSVNSAYLLSDGKTVVLGLSGLNASNYTLSYTVADLASNAAASTVSVTNISNGFAIQDFGVTPPGLAYGTNVGSFTVFGGGSDIFGTNDDFNYCFKSFTGDFDIRLRINGVAGANGSTRGGLMIREDTSPGSRNLFVGAYLPANNAWVSTYRAAANATTLINNGALPSRGAGFAFPNAWVRFSRVGQTFTAYYSTNNLDWKQYGTNVIVSPAYPDTVMVGMASTSISTNTAGTFQYADFTQFSLAGGTISITNQPTNTTVLAYRPVTFIVGATLSGNNDPTLLSYQWLSNGVPVDGAIHSSFTFNLPAPTDSGTQFRCNISAPGIAPVASAIATLTVTPDTNPPVALNATSQESHTVAIQFDELLDPNTANQANFYTVDGGFNVLSAQLQADGRTVLLSVDGLVAPQFQVTISGVADLSGNPGNYTVTGQNAGLTMADLNNGYLIPSQIVAVTTNGFTVNAPGSDIFGTADSFNFVYEWLTNDFDVRVQFVNSTPLQNASQRGGLMARVDNSLGSPNVFVGTYAPGSFNAWVTTERSTEDGSTVIDSRPAWEPGVAFPNTWLRLKRSGQALGTYESRDGFNWVQLGTNITDITLPDGLMVGMASTPVSTYQARFQYANFGPTIPIPGLIFELAQGNAKLSWPTNAVGFSLQQADSLPAAGWSPVTNAPVSIGDQQQVTVPAASGTKFYRLVH